MPRPVALPGLIGLRGVGALWVVVYHVQHGLHWPVADRGYLGVDLFFILSGFVLSHANFRMQWNWLNYRVFVQNRFARIFPLHWATMGMLLLTIWLYPKIYTDMPHKFEWQSFIPSMLLMQNWGLGRPAPWNGPAWTLSTEWLVSLAFPVFLAVARCVRHPMMAAVLCAASLGLFGIFLILSGNITPDVATLAGVLRTICEFAAGCLLYRVYLGNVRIGAAVMLCAAGLILVGILVPYLAMLAVFGFPVLVLLSAQPVGTVSRLLSGQIIVFLGEISFSIYLNHWIILMISNRAQEYFQITGFFSFLWFCGYLGVTLIFSAATYRWIEVPARRWLRVKTPVKAGSSRSDALAQSS